MNKESEITKIALIGNNIEYIKKDVVEIKQSIKELGTIYPTKVEFDDFKELVDKRLKHLEDQDRLWKWLAPSLSAIFASIVTFLVIEYLTKLK